MGKKYYEAYNDRYKAAHEKGVSWASDESSPIVLAAIKKYKPEEAGMMLEIGCGEGRDAKAVPDEGYRLLATDISKEAVEYCKKQCLRIGSILRLWIVLMIFIRENMILSIQLPLFICLFWMRTEMLFIDLFVSI